MKPSNQVRKDIIKYGKMDFDYFWKEYKKRVNRRRNYKRSKFMKFLFGTKNPILEEEYAKSIAKYFFEKGRLQMIASVGLDNLKLNMKEVKA